IGPARGRRQDDDREDQPRDASEAGGRHGREAFAAPFLVKSAEPSARCCTPLSSQASTTPSAASDMGLPCMLRLVLMMAPVPVRTFTRARRRYHGSASFSTTICGRQEPSGPMAPAKAARPCGVVAKPVVMWRLVSRDPR